MGNNKILKIGLHNAGSLGTDHDNFIVAMERFSVDIMAINETWLRPGEDARAPCVPNYRLRHIPRPSSIRGGRGGGIGFYIKRGVNVRSCAHPINPSVEQMWLKLNIKSSKLIIGTAYRPPWLDVNIFLDALMDSVTSFSRYDNIIVMGDFNIDMLNVNDPKTKFFKEFLSCTGLSQIIDKPTHFTDSSKTLIDVVCSNVRSRNVCVDLIGSHIGHAFITCELIFKKPKLVPRCITFRPIKDINLELFTIDLESVGWSIINSMDHIDRMVDSFTEVSILLFDLHAPTKSIIVKELPSPWLTDNIRLMMRLRDASLARYRETEIPSHKLYYKDLKSLVSTGLHNEKKAFFKQSINFQIKNPKLLWRNLKANVLPRKSTELPPQFDNPDAINEHFLCIPGNLTVSISHLTFFEFHRFNSSIFSFEPTNSVKVSKFLKEIKTNARGIDDISLEMITLMLPQCLDTLTNMINKSITSAVFPTAWKTAIVKPLPKISTPLDIKDLRPISLLPCLSKVLEKVVSSQVTKYLEDHNILPDMQSGFRKGRGTNTALLDVTDNILAAQDEGMGTILVLLDFSRAFDSIDISLLLAKLNYYGFDSSVVQWFNSYLSNRTQIVEIKLENGEALRSAAREVNRGVPQGSILGPLLFILYTADIINIINHAKFHIYADDIQMYISFKPKDLRAAEAKLNEDLGRIQEWAMSNSLLLNAKKTKYMILGSKHQTHQIAMNHPHLVIGGEVIERVSEARNLGLLLDEQLRFEHHVSETAKNCFYRLRVLYKIRDYLSTEIRISLVDSLVLSRFNYLDCVYGPCLYTKTSRLIQRVQNACARFCFQIPPRNHITPFLNQNKVLNMNHRRNLHLATLMFGVVKFQQPSYLFSKLVFARTSKFSIRLSCSYLLRNPRHGTAAFRGSFRFSATKCWNCLPPPIRNLNTKFGFRIKLKQYLLDQQKLLV